jgi:hypothetical protein
VIVDDKYFHGCPPSPRTFVRRDPSRSDLGGTLSPNRRRRHPRRKLQGWQAAPPGASDGRAARGSRQAVRRGQRVISRRRSLPAFPDRKVPAL